MSRILKIFLITLCWVVAGMTFCNSSNATIYFYYDAENEQVGATLPLARGNPANFCQTECSGSGEKGTIQLSGDVPQGNKYFQWKTVDNQANHYTIVGSNTLPSDSDGWPITLTLGKTYYLAFYSRFDRIGGNDIWHEGNNTQSADKGVELYGPDIRLLVTRGQWEHMSANQDHHYTSYISIMKGSNPLVTWGHNQNGYTPTNPLQLEYERWYALILGFNLSYKGTGSVTLWIDGQKIEEHANINTLEDTGSPIITRIQMGGTIAQPAYDAPAHYRKFDALILTDNWQDIVDGGYLGEVDDDDTTPPGDVTNLEALTGDSQVVLNWTNPNDSDFKGTLIRYRTDGTYPTNNSDGIEVCNKTASLGSNDTYTLTGLSNGITYYFSAFTYDEDSNYSKTAYISATPCANVYTKTFGDISGADFPQTCKDTFLNAGKAEVNYSSNSEFLNTYTWPTNTVANRIVMKWDLSALPKDAIIQEATLSLYMHGYSGTGGDDNYEITAHKIINHNPDILSCTWNIYDATNSWTGGANGGEQDIAPAESSTIVDKTSGYKNWDITQMVQEWVDNSSTNFGLMLNSDTTAASDSNRYFRPTEYTTNQDQRPVLTIKYCGIEVPIPSAPSGLKVDD